MLPFIMQLLTAFIAGMALFVPGVLMLYTASLAFRPSIDPAVSRTWRQFQRLSVVTVVASLITLIALWSIHPSDSTEPFWIVSDWIGLTRFSVVFALLVQGLGLVIGSFSARYLQGEPRQYQYITWLAGVLASVQWLILAQNWVILITAWLAVGVFMQRLLCFYEDRPFALLAARKKHLADRIADLLLIAGALLIWHEVGQGSFAAAALHVQSEGAGLVLQAGTVMLVLAVIVRTALMPAHGWLTQVMEAPTPVSALLHAGVVNLGGFVLIQISPLMDAVAPARWLLIAMGLATALLAGLIILTRISIKVRLAWSTIAQMGFMVLECGLGLYTLAALHLIGHSLYKAHAFLRASSVVQDARLHRMQPSNDYSWTNLLTAPVMAMALTIPVVSLPIPGTDETGLPIWWAILLSLAWAPLFWLGQPMVDPRGQSGKVRLWKLTSAALLLIVLSLITRLSHLLPMGINDSTAAMAGWVSAVAMGVFYLILVGVHRCPARLETLRRWSYAGFYVDEFYTRLTLRLWPGKWMPSETSGHGTRQRWKAGRNTSM